MDPDRGSQKGFFVWVIAVFPETQEQTNIIIKIWAIIKNLFSIFQVKEDYCKEAFHCQLELDVALRLPFLLYPLDEVPLRRPNSDKFADKGMVPHVTSVLFQLVCWDHISGFLCCTWQELSSTA